MPLSPEEPQIHESVPGREGGVGTTRTPQASRSSVPLPGPRTAPRPAPPRSDRAGRPAPGPGRAGARGAGTSPAQPPVRPPVPAPTAPPGPTPAPDRSAADIQLVGATDENAVDAADDIVDGLLDSGRAPGEVLVLSTGGLHPWAEHEQSFGEDAYWRQMGDADDVFCAHTSALARVTGRPVVVLAVNGGADADIARALPPALEKAGERLVVCGDPKRLGSLL